MIKKHNKAFGNVLRKLRKRKKFSQEYLGFEANLSRTFVSLLERGLRSPTLDTMMALCMPLETSIAALTQQIETEMMGDDGSLSK